MHAERDRGDSPPTLAFPGSRAEGLVARCRRFADLTRRIDDGPGLDPGAEDLALAELEAVEAEIRAAIGDEGGRPEAVALPDGSLLLLESGLLRFIDRARVFRAEAG